MDSRLAASIVRASACRCGARIGQKCADSFGVPVLPHPDRQKRAANRFPAIAEALAAMPALPAAPSEAPSAAASPRLAKSSGEATAAAPAVKAARRPRRALLTPRQLKQASELQGTRPLYAIARRYHVSTATLSNYLKQAGLFKQDAGRDEHGRFLKGFTGNAKGRPAHCRPPTATASLTNTAMG